MSKAAPAAIKVPEPGPDNAEQSEIDAGNEVSGDLRWSQSISQGGASIGSFSVYEFDVKAAEATPEYHDYPAYDEYYADFAQKKDNRKRMRRKKHKRFSSNRRASRMSPNAESKNESASQAPTSRIIAKKQRPFQKFRPQLEAPEQQGAASERQESGAVGTREPLERKGSHGFGASFGRTRISTMDTKIHENNVAGGKESDKIWEEAQRRAERMISGVDNRFDEAGDIFDLTRVGGESGAVPSVSNPNNDVGTPQKVASSSSSTGLLTLIPTGEALYGLPSVSRIGKSYAKSFDSKGKAEKTDAFRKLHAAAQRTVEREVVVGREGGTENLLREIDAVKYICLRERLLGNLVAVCRQTRILCHSIVTKRGGVNRPVDAGLLHQVGTQQDIMRTLVRELQRASIAVVTAISRWRQSVTVAQQKRSGPNGVRTTTFRWKGGNYLLTMQKDLRFLSRHRADRMYMKRHGNSNRQGKGRGILSGNIGGEISANVMTEGEAMLAEKLVDPIGYWLGFEPRDHPLLIPPEDLDVARALRHEREQISELAAQKLKSEAEARANALRAAHMARMGGIVDVVAIVDKDENGNGAEMEEVVLAGKEDEEPEDDEEEESILEESNENAQDQKKVSGEANGSSKEDKDNSDTESEPQPPEEPPVPWTFWIADMAPKTNLASSLPKKAVTLHSAALQVLAEEAAIEARWKEERRQRDDPDEEKYDPVVRIAEHGGVDMLLSEITSSQDAEVSASVADELRRRQQQRNLRVSLWPRGSAPRDRDSIDAGVCPALDASRDRVQSTVERAIEDSRPRVAKGPSASIHEGRNFGGRLQGSLLVGELPLNIIKRQCALLDRAASTIQAMIRGYLARKPGGRVDMLREARLRSEIGAATGLQSIIRGYLARNLVEDIRFNMPAMDKNVAATIIQCMARCFFARRSVDIERTYLETMKFAEKSKKGYNGDDDSRSRRRKHRTVLVEEKDEEMMLMSRETTSSKHDDVAGLGTKAGFVERTRSLVEEHRKEEVTMDNSGDKGANRDDVERLEATTLANSHDGYKIDA